MAETSVSSLHLISLQLVFINNPRAPPPRTSLPCLEPSVLHSSLTKSSSSKSPFLPLPHVHLPLAVTTAATITGEIANAHTRHHPPTRSVASCLSAASGSPPLPHHPTTNRRSALRRLQGSARVKTFVRPRTSRTPMLSLSMRACWSMLWGRSRSGVETGKKRSSSFHSKVCLSSPPSLVMRSPCFLAGSQCAFGARTAIAQGRLRGVGDSF